jgi:hypothetical protein
MVSGWNVTAPLTKVPKDLGESLHDGDMCAGHRPPGLRANSVTRAGANDDFAQYALYTYFALLPKTGKLSEIPETTAAALNGSARRRFDECVTCSCNDLIGFGVASAIHPWPRKRSQGMITVRSFFAIPHFRSPSHQDFSRWDTVEAGASAHGRRVR